MLTNINIPNSVTSIGDNAFENCVGLTNILLPNSVTSIGMNAFHYCINLTNINIPNGVTALNAFVFSDCAKLPTVVLPATLTGIGWGAFEYCSSLKTLIIPNNVTLIGNSAFGYCTSLTSLKIPSKVTSIGNQAFRDCTGMKELFVRVANPANTSLGYNVFYNFPTNFCILYIPKGTKPLYIVADQWKDFINQQENVVAKHNVISQSQKYDNIVEFDYDGYFSIFTEFNFENALRFLTLKPTINNEEIKLHINKSNDSFSVSGFDGKNSISIINMSGRVVISQPITSNESISLRKLPKSVYLVKITGEKNVFAQKIVKE
jgi:hypothetical protein